MSNLAYLLGDWVRKKVPPRGGVHTGDVRVRIEQNPDTFVGVDLAYFSAELVAKTTDDALFFDGLPILVVEIMSSTDTAERMAEKVHAYLDAGVPLVWEVNPFYHTVMVHRPDTPPVLFNEQQELTAEPHLPGLRVPVAEVFAA